MTIIFKRNLLALMLATASVAMVLPAITDVASYAKDGGGSGSGESGGGSSSGSGDSGSDSDSDSSSDSDSGSNSDSKADGGKSNDKNDDRDNNNKSDKNAERSSSRPTVTLSLSSSHLADVVAGRSVVVDQLGRQLEVIVRSVNGNPVVTGKPHGGDAKRNPGPVTNVTVVSAASVPANDDGTPDQGKGDILVK